MKVLENIYINKKLQNELLYVNEEHSPCRGIDNVSIVVHKKKLKKRRKIKMDEHTQQPITTFRLSGSRISKRKHPARKHSSMPELNKTTKSVQPRTKSFVAVSNKNNHPFHSKYTVNLVSQQRFIKSPNPFNYPKQTKWNIYRCQIISAEDSCCCSCNSDAMFEVMKSLYDCYKKKNCDDCDCILCGHKHREERRLGELRKSLGVVGLEATPSAKQRKERMKKAEKLLEKKSPAEKERLLREMVKAKQPLPEGKTPSEKALINKIRAELGLPPEPKNAAERAKMRKAEAAGIITPLEGKTPEQKEKILKALAAMGIPLPEGRTKSEKALIDKVKAEAAAGIPGIPSEKLRKAKAAGLITPLEGKSPEEKEKILKGLAMYGLPLPEGKTASQKKLIDKVRADLGLPPEPKTQAMRDKHAQAAKAGLLQPLEGKSSKDKEKILKGLQDLGIPLPEGRTPSEKALIAKVKAESLAKLSPSEKMRRAKAAGLLTPLRGKTPEEKEKILKGLAMHGIPLPEGKTPSEKKLIDKVRAELGLPPEPTTDEMKAKHAKAAKAGLLQPLEGKTPAEKEKILKGLHDLGIPLPEGRTASEKSLIAKIKARPRELTLSEKKAKAKAAGLLTPLEGKSPAEKEKILRDLALAGIPLPEGKTPSEKKLIDKIRAELGLPPEPKNAAMRDKHAKAAEAGLLQPLEGKSPKEKEKILKGLHDIGIPLPEGRTPSEKALIAKIKAGAIPLDKLSPSEKMQRAKAAGLLTPLQGKSPEEKEKILKGLAMHGIPLPEGRTASEKKLIDKVRAELGLPPEPTTEDMRAKHAKAAKEGLLQPLEGKTPAEKKKILQGLHDLGIPLPEGRTASEKSLIAKIKAGAIPLDKLSPSEKMRKAKAAGLLTPLQGKSPEEKEKILKGLAMHGIPLPEGRTASEKKLIDKVRAELGLPPEPTTDDMRAKHAKAAKAGLLQPLEGKTPAEKKKILQGLHDLGIPLPEGRTASEKSLIAKIKAGAIPLDKLSPSEKMRKAKAAGLLTPLQGKSPQEKEKILKGLAMHGIPLPEGKTPSEKKLIDKVRAELGLPPEPTTDDMRAKHAKAAKAGLLQPLEGKTPAEKKKILQGLHDLGIPLPEGRTASEKSLIAKIKAGAIPLDKLSPSEKMRKAKAAGLLTPLQGKSPEEKEKILKGLAMHGIPLPEGRTASEKKLIDKVRAELGLPPEPTSDDMRAKHAKAAREGLLQPLEGKTPAEKKKILQGLHDLGIPLPEGRTASEKSLIAKIKGKPALTPSQRKAKAAGLPASLEGKSPAEKEKILRDLAMAGIPLPEGKTPSEKKLIDKIRAELGLPPEPKNATMRDKHAKAAEAGLLQPLEGKSPKEKEKILKGLHDLGIPLPEGRTPSEKALIAKIKAGPKPSLSKLSPSEKMRRAKAAGLLTPLQGKSPEEKEKILKGLAMHGIPLPEGRTASEKKLIDKVRAELGLPPEPTTDDMRAKHAKAAKEGLLQPLEGKTHAEKKKILQGLHDAGIPLPKGRTASEKSLIAKIKAGAPRSERKGVLSPLAGKTPAEKERILKALAMKGIPLPEGKTPSEKKLIDKIRAELGLPPEPTSPAMRDKYAKAAEAGLLQPLEGKSPKEKEKILKGLHDLGIPLPEGRTPSEKALIAQIKAGPRAPSALMAASEKLRKAKAAGLLTPLEGKTPEQKEKILKNLAKRGIPLPEAKTPSEQKLMDKIRAELGLPPEPKTPEMKDKHAKAAAAGLLVPLEGKTPEEKRKILQGLHDLGIPLPVGRTPSEKSLIAKIKAGERKVPLSEKKRIAKAAGLLSPLAGKSPAEKEKILKALAMQGVPLPEGKTPSEKKLIDKIRDELGLPPEPTTAAMKDKHAKAAEAGLLVPLEGKTPEQKRKILQGLHDLGIPLPLGRTPSEKSLIAKIKAGEPKVSLSEKKRIAKAAGLLSPLSGKTPAEKEKILKALAMQGIPLPEGKTPSEKKLIDKIRADLGLPPEPTTAAMKDKHAKAAEAGLLVPLEGKTPEQKRKILQGLHDLGIPLPLGRTPSEKSLIAKIKGGVPLSEKKRIAKAAGLLSPLAGKSPAEKEKLLKALAMQGVPLPEGKTPSEKKLIDKVRAELGLPPEPTTASMKDKHAKAADAGFLQPLEGKSTRDKEKILKGLHDLGIPLPEGRTPSEKALIAKIKAGSRAPSEKKGASITTDKIKKAKAAGLLTPLSGKTPEQKEKILRGLAKAGLPLPDGKTPSEKALIKKIKKEFGIPDRTPSEKLRKAKAAGLLTPLEGKTPAQKEKILRGRAAAGLPLPIGKTPSERALIQKIKDETGYVTPSPSERLRKAKAAGLITPLKGKTPAQKEQILKNMLAAGVPIPEGETPSEKEMIRRLTGELPKTLSEKMKKAKTAGLLTPLKGKTPEQKKKILKDLIKAGLPLPEPQTASEKDLMDKVRQEMGLPPEPKTPSIKEKYKKAQAAGIITPLEGKTPAQKEKILKKLHDAGIPLPEGRTPSEKSMINRIKKGLPARKTPSGVLSPLEGKTPAQKEKILRALAKAGKPLPEGKTKSEKDLINRIRKELGLPPEPKTPSMKERHAKAADAGLLVPLEGLSPAEKEKVLRGQAALGLPLPEGRTPSEKALIDKIIAESKPKKVSAGKIEKAKAAGLLTPLEGKTPAEKEKILRGLAEAGLPLPEGKTPSEKSLINRIRTEFGIPPPATTPSEKSIIRKAKADGLFTPLTGKTPAEKEKILRGLAAAGLPLPIGKTPSEKELIKKVRAEAGLPPLPTPSERLGKIRKKKAKSKKIGVTADKLGKGIAAQEFEDVIKAETCDRGCGCDKKKIRFKHSYVKIRVTSPDISALCPCPEECIPGVKAGAFIDNEGIKVTVGSAVGIPSYSRECVQTYDENLLKGKPMRTLFDHTNKRNKISSDKLYRVQSYDSDPSDDNVDYVLNTTSSDETFNSELTLNGLPYNNDTENDQSILYFNTKHYEGKVGEPKSYIKTRRFESSGDIYTDPVSKDDMQTDKSSRDSFDSILVIKSETSLSLSTNSSENMDTISVMSFTNSSLTSNSTHYFDYQLSNDLFSNSSTEDSDYSTNRIIYRPDEPITSESYILESQVFNAFTEKLKREITGIHKQEEYQVFRMSQTKVNPFHEKKSKSKQKSKAGEPIVVINHLNSESDITTMVDELLAKNDFSGASSIFVVVPSDDNEAGNSSDGRNSTICIQMSENPTKWKSNNQPSKKNSNPSELDTPQRRTSSTYGVKISSKGKRFFMEGIPSTVLTYQNKETMFDYQHLKTESKPKEKTKNKLCQITTPNEIVQLAEHKCHVVSTDTTADRPCCCAPKEHHFCDYSSNDRYVANVTSKQITPLLVKQGLNCDRFRLSGITMAPQASFLSLNISPTPVTPCQIPPCMLPRSSRPPLEKNPQTGPQSPCQCTPERLRELLEQAINSGRISQMKSTACGGATPEAPPADAAVRGAPYRQDDCGSCLHPPLVDECECSGVKKRKKVKPSCPCARHQPPGQKIEPSPAAPCDEACPIGKDGRASEIKRVPMRQTAQTQLIGPAGESTQIQTGETYTQAGTKQTRFSSTIGTSTDTKSCVCKDKKRKKVLCECPSPEPEPEPEPEPDIEALDLTYMVQSSDFEWVDKREIGRMKSSLTERVSGFKINQKKKPPPQAPDEDFTLDDAIRYYATMKPELFKDIIQDQLRKQEQRERRVSEVPGRQRKNNVDCECPEEPPPPPPPPPPVITPEPSEPEEPETQEDEGIFRGLKFKMGGKGSGSPGLAGICCFDLLQESFTTW